MKRYQYNYYTWCMVLKTAQFEMWEKNLSMVIYDTGNVFSAIVSDI